MRTITLRNISGSRAAAGSVVGVQCTNGA